MTVLQDNAQYKYRVEFKKPKLVDLPNGLTQEIPETVFKRWAKYQTVTERYRNAVTGFNSTTDIIINVREIYKDPINTEMNTEVFTVTFRGRDYNIYAISPNQRIGGNGYHIITLRKVNRAE